jgi:hypothetical protein
MEYLTEYGYGTMVLNALVLTAHLGYSFLRSTITRL